MPSMKIELLPILLDGLPYAIDPTGEFAINQAGKAVKLYDMYRSKSRFK